MPTAIYESRETTLRTRSGHSQNAYTLRCECGYPLYLQDTCGGRRTCTQCRIIWDISSGRIVSESRGAWAVTMTNHGQRARTGRVPRGQRASNSPAATTHTAAVEVLFPTLTETGRTFGIEIELSGLGTREAAQAIQRAGLPCTAEGYNHELRTHWKATMDSTVINGCEIVSPKLTGERGLAQLYLVCEALTNAGATINRSCGIHVHIDAAGMNGEQYANFFKAYVTFEETIDSFMPPSRRANASGYCQSLTRNSDGIMAAANRSEIITALRRDRNLKVNPMSFSRHGTIEVRHHSGTTEYTKLLNWVRLLLAMAQSASENKAINSHNTDLEGLLDWASPSDDTKNFFRMRVAHFAQRQMASATAAL